MTIISFAGGQVERRLLGGLGPSSPWLAILDQAGMATAVLNADFDFLHLNHHFAMVADTTPNQLIGRNYFEVFPTSSGAAVFHKVRNSGVAYVHSPTSVRSLDNPLGGAGQWKWSLTPVGHGDRTQSGITQYLILAMQPVQSSPDFKRGREQTIASDQRDLCRELPCLVYRTLESFSRNLLFNSEALTGYLPAEIDALPDHWRTLIHPDDLAVFDAQCRQLRQGPAQAVLTYRIIAKDGSLRRVEDRRSALFAANGRFSGFAGVVVDHSLSGDGATLDRQKDSPDYDTRTTLDHGYWLTDGQGRLLDVNEVYCRLSGYTRDEILELTVDEIDVGMADPNGATGLKRLIDRNGQCFTSTHRRRDGTTWPVAVQSFHSPDAGGRFFVLLHDIERRQQTERRREAHERLSTAAETESIDGILQVALTEVKALTGSRSGFFELGSPEDYETDHAANDPSAILARHPHPSAGRTAGPLAIPAVLDGKIAAILHLGDKDDEYTALEVATTSEIVHLAIRLVAKRCAELALQAREKRLRRFLEVMPHGYSLQEVVVDAEGRPCDYRFIDVNPAFEAIAGLSRDRIIGHCLGEILPTVDKRWIERFGALALSGDCAQFDDFRSDLDRHYRVTVFCPEAGQCAAIYDDITASWHNERAMRDVAAVFENTREGMVITDAQATIIAVNRAFTEITRYTREEALGHPMSMLKSGQHATTFYEAMWNALITKGFWQGEICNRRQNGETYPQWLTINAVVDEHGRTERYIGVFSDITRFREHEARIEFIACHDTLTRLPNRTLLDIHYQHALARAELHGNKLALLILDIDQFKKVNDDYGHEFGDRLLVAISGRIKSRLRDEDTLARLRGDKFAVLMEDVELADDAAVLARDLLEVLEAPFRIGHVEHVPVTASIGIRVSSDGGRDTATLLSDAEVALRTAKAQGPNTFRFHEA